MSNKIQELIHTTEQHVKDDVSKVLSRMTSLKKDVGFVIAQAGHAEHEAKHAVDGLFNEAKLALNEALDKLAKAKDAAGRLPHF